MITIHRAPGSADGACTRHRLAPGEALPADAVWIDLFKPTREEDSLVEAHIGIEVPTREDMADIEPSELLYTNHGARYMTARVLCGNESERPYIGAVSFVLTKTSLVTVRYDETHTFVMFEQHMARPGDSPTTPGGVLAGLIEAISDRSATVLNRVGDRVDELSHQIFETDNARDTKRQKETLKSLGRAGDLVSQVRESLVSFERMLLFISGETHPANGSSDLRSQAQSTLRDQQSLEEHATFISGKIQFLLDAILGLVNLEQNNIIKLFSVISVVFSPPTLVASIYGMNFKNMPELDWTFGYPMALCMMLASAVLPYVFFRWKHWL
jgi:magnesium transporter